MFCAVLICVASACATVSERPNPCATPEEPVRIINDKLNPPDELCDQVRANHFSRVSINQTQCSEFDYWRQLMRYWYAERTEDFRKKAWSCGSNIWSFESQGAREVLLTHFGCMFEREQDASEAFRYLTERFSGGTQRFSQSRVSSSRSLRKAFVVHAVGSQKLAQHCIDRFAATLAQDKKCISCGD